MSRGKRAPVRGNNTGRESEVNMDEQEQVGWWWWTKGSKEERGVKLGVGGEKNLPHCLDHSAASQTVCQDPVFPSSLLTSELSYWDLQTWSGIIYHHNPKALPLATFEDHRWTLSQSGLGGGGLFYLPYPAWNRSIYLLVIEWILFLTVFILQY